MFPRLAILMAIIPSVLSISQAEEPLKVAIVGCDTSHAVAFAKVINDPAATGALAKVEVVCAFPGGSDDIPASRDRVKGFTEQLRGMGVTIVDSLEAARESTLR